MELSVAYPDMQFPRVFIHFWVQFMWFPHVYIAFSLCIFSWVPKSISRPLGMQLPHVFIAFFMCDQAFPNVFIACWYPLGFLLGAHWVLLGSPLRHVGGVVGPKCSQKHQDEGLKIDLGSSRGSQGVSEGLNGSILGRCSSLVLCYLVFWYSFCKKGLCIMVAASHCS